MVVKLYLIDRAKCMSLASWQQTKIPAHTDRKNYSLSRRKVEVDLGLECKVGNKAWWAGQYPPAVASPRKELSTARV